MKSNKNPHDQTIKQMIERIATIRVSKNLSQRELSLRINKNAGYIHMLETNKNFAPTFDTFLDILEVFEMSINQFFYEPYGEYNTDYDIIKMLKFVSPKKKEAILTLLSNNE